MPRDQRAPSSDGGIVIAVSASSTHSVSKTLQKRIQLIEGRGVAGDAHAGRRIKHRSRLANPEQPNLRQVHLIHGELHDELATRGFEIGPGQMGENITTRGTELLGLPRGARLHVGESAVIEVTGLRNPCSQLDGLQEGLMAAVLDRRADGSVIRKSGIMAIVKAGGEIRPGDPIRVVLPEPPHQPLERV